MPLSRRVTEEELRLFSERIAQSLRERPLTLGLPAQREGVAALLRQVGDATHYQLLAIDPAAPLLAVHEAYERTARLIHPDNAGRLGLAGREGVLELLFERVTEAYLILSDRERRKRYDRQQGASLWAAGPVAAAARGEEARRLFEKAKALADGEQYHPAIELLREAVRTTPKAEYLALLGLLQAKNPLWLRKAEESLARALELGARDPSLPAALSEVRRRLDSGDTSRPDQDSREVEIL